MKFFKAISRRMKHLKSGCLMILLFAIYPLFSKNYSFSVPIKATSFIAFYKIDPVEYKNKWDILPHLNNNKFRIICDHDSVHFSCFTNIDSLKFTVAPGDTFNFRVLFNNDKIASAQVIGYGKSENYTDAYIKGNTNTITLDIPEVSELVKIILMLNQDALENAIDRKNSIKDVYASGYYDDVLSHFYKFRKEKIVDVLYDYIKNDSFASTPGKYLDIKRFSSLYRFNIQNELVRSGYYIVEAGNYYDVLEPYLPLLNDFAKKTGFREFYKDHLATYKEAKELYLKLVPVNSLWNFTESHFTHKVQYYKIIFSPLESFYYVSTVNYNKGLPFNQYTYYASTPIWRIDNDKNFISYNYVKNSYRFFQQQFFQYMDDYYRSDTLAFDNIFKKKNNWAYRAYVNEFDNENKILAKDIFYWYVGDALFSQYYEKYLKKQFEDIEPLDFNVLFNQYYGELFDEHRLRKRMEITLLKTDKFNSQFAALYKKYGPQEFDSILTGMKEWCKKQK